MKKVLFVVNSLPFFLSHRKPIADRLIKEGYEVHLAAGKLSGTPPPGIIWHELPLQRGGTNPLTELFTFFSMFSIIRKVRPSIIHLVTIKPVLYGGLIAKFFPNIPIVSAISGLGSIFTNSNKFKTVRFIATSLYKIALNRKKIIVIFQNSDDKEKIQKITNLKNSQTSLIRGSGVDLNHYKYSDESSPTDGVVVTMASRLLKDKGIIEFIEAATILQNENIKFYIIGDIDSANPESLTQNELEHYSKIKNITFLGHKANIQDYFANSHLVVLPSYREGLPKVLCEAASSGRAVITTDVPGCRDAIISVETGLLIPIKNSNALASAIRELSLNHSRRKIMGMKGREFAEKEFDINVIVEKHLEIYKKMGL